MDETIRVTLMTFCIVKNTLYNQTLNLYMKLTNLSGITNYNLGHTEIELVRQQ